ncbi:unnamed protein product, partial [Diatraea saccharalis]
MTNSRTFCLHSNVTFLGCAHTISHSRPEKLTNEYRQSVSRVCHATRAGVISGRVNVENDLFYIDSGLGVVLPSLSQILH